MRTTETTINAKHFTAFCHFQDESTKCYMKKRSQCSHDIIAISEC
jgi:hypothetical protein